MELASLLNDIDDPRVIDFHSNVIDATATWKNEPGYMYLESEAVTNEFLKHNPATTISEERIRLYKGGPYQRFTKVKVDDLKSTYNILRYYYQRVYW